VFGQDNQINYKLMEKVPVNRLKPTDVRCLEEAIQNLEACIPTQPAEARASHASQAHTKKGKSAAFEKAVAMPIVSQKQMVESLEQIMEQRRTDSRSTTKSNPLYRQCLKIHHLFLLHVEAHGGTSDSEEPLKLPVAVQVETLLQILGQ
jgi:hypothetical protein